MTDPYIPKRIMSPLLLLILGRCTPCTARLQGEKPCAKAGGARRPAARPAHPRPITGQCWVTPLGPELSTAFGAERSGAASGA